MKRNLLLLCCVVPLLVSCGVIWGAAVPATSVSTMAGDPERGEQLFNLTDSTVLPCATCHRIGDDEGRRLGRLGYIVGPDLNGLSAHAAERIPGMSAEEYIRDSILDPSSYLVEGYRDLMYPNYAEVLTEQDIQDLIAYILSF